jgi:hypothetical protein
MQRLLQGGSGGHGVGGLGKDGEAAVALPARAHEETTVPLDVLLYEDIMARQRLAHGVGVLLPQQGATLDVGEEEGDGPGRKLHARGFNLTGAKGA